MFNPGYYITAELKVKVPENIDKARQHLKELCEETLKEPGCSIFTLHQCLDDKSRFLLWERFNSEDDFKYHFEALLPKSAIRSQRPQPQVTATLGAF